jgi:DNA repair protein RecN (Recombination protein N)
MKEMRYADFAITHLPQIASKGDAHFKVFKSIGEDTQSECSHRMKNASLKLLKCYGDSCLRFGPNHAKALLN